MRLPFAFTIYMLRLRFTCRFTFYTISFRSPSQGAVTLVALVSLAKARRSGYEGSSDNLPPPDDVDWITPICDDLALQLPARRPPRSQHYWLPAPLCGPPLESAALSRY